MNTLQMRVELSRLYGDQWRKRVNKMNDDQVVAVYFRLKKSGKLN